MALFSRRRRGRAEAPIRTAGSDVDERIWGRKYSGPPPWVLGLLVFVAASIGIYLSFAKQLPWSSPGYEVTATFDNVASLRKSAPVRIAGVNVGKVTAIGSEGETAKVTFSVDEAGRPLHADAVAEIRPRLFLEGNYFIDLQPGSPSAAELDDGDSIPVTQTATAVQLDEVLTALQTPQRRGLQKLLKGFGTALTYEPTAADDADQDPDVRGRERRRVAQRRLPLRQARRPRNRDRQHRPARQPAR